MVCRSEGAPDALPPARGDPATRPAPRVFAIGALRDKCVTNSCCRVQLQCTSVATAFGEAGGRQERQNPRSTSCRTDSMCLIVHEKQRDMWPRGRVEVVGEGSACPGHDGMQRPANGGQRFGALCIHPLDDGHEHISRQLEQQALLSWLHRSKGFDFNKDQNGLESWKAIRPAPPML